MTEQTPVGAPMTMREKMARAMAHEAAPGCDPDAEVSCGPPLDFPSPRGTAHMMPMQEYRMPYWKLFLLSADAALDALMEPTPEMTNHQVLGELWTSSHLVEWQSMIRAAKEGK